jgi:3',5'-cyclic-AMP phosphodiesterase
LYDAAMPVYLPPISRRRFLKGSLAAAAALALGQGCALPRKPRDPHNVALLSDIHISANPHLVARNINMTNNLRTVTQEVLAWPQTPGLAFINGDLAFNSGTAADYSAVLGLLEPLRADGMPIWLGLGNHDNRPRFWQSFAKSKSVQPGLPDRQAAIVRTPRANWFLLDSLIQTKTTPGMLGDAQRAWLAAALDSNADKPALVLIHHQPGSIAPDHPGSGLEDAPELFAILRPRKHVKAYIFGHTHRWHLREDESGIHLINLPPTAYLFEAGPPNGWVHASIAENGARLELRCLDRSHKDHGQVVNLAWRTA